MATAPRSLLFLPLKYPCPFAPLKSPSVPLIIRLDYCTVPVLSSEKLVAPWLVEWRRLDEGFLTGESFEATVETKDRNPDCFEVGVTAGDPCIAEVGVLALDPCFADCLEVGVGAGDPCIAEVGVLADWGVLAADPCSCLEVVVKVGDT